MSVSRQSIHVYRSSYGQYPTESRPRTGSRQKNPDRQTPDSIFSKNPDRIQTPDKIETEKTRTDGHRTAFFSKNPDRIRTADRIESDRFRTDRHLTENPDLIRTADGHWTEFSGKSGQKRDTDRTRTVLSADVCFAL